MNLVFRYFKIKGVKYSKLIAQVDSADIMATIKLDASNILGEEVKGELKFNLNKSGARTGAFMYINGCTVRYEWCQCVDNLMVA
jgi:hypothetical protein